MVHDACYNKAMASYGKWSARAAQAVAKCRKATGHVRKGQARANLRRWGREKWVDKRTGKPCGSGGSTQYCRPTHRVSSKTPAMPRGKTLSRAISRKVRTGRGPTLHKSR